MRSVRARPANLEVTSREAQPSYTLEVDGKQVAVAGYADETGSYRGKPEVHAAAPKLLRSQGGGELLRVIGATGTAVETFRRGLTTHIGGRVLDNPAAAKDQQTRLAKKLARGTGRSKD